ncbi:MAG: cytosine permease [Microbacteriaceae bacterium]
MRAETKLRQAEKHTAVETEGIQPIPESARHGSLISQFTFWFTASVQFATLTAGALTTSLLGLDLGQAVLAFSVGSAIGAAALGLLATGGPRMGVPQMVQARGPFGFRGNYLPAILFFITAIGWFGVTTVLGVFVLQALVELPLIPTTIILAAVEVFIAVVGYKLMHLVQNVLSYLLIVVFVIVSIFTFSQVDLAAPVHGAAAAIGVGGAMSVAIAISTSRLLSFSAAASDYSRYLPRSTSSRKVFLCVFLGTFVSSAWIGSIGAALGLAIKLGTPADLVAGALPAGLVVVILLSLFLSTASSSTIDVYSSSLSLLTMGLRIPQWATALIVGTIGAALAVIAGIGDFYGQFQSFLVFLGYWLAPFVAIMIVRLALSARRPALTDLGALYDESRQVGVGLPALLIGIAASVPFMSSTIFTGFVAQANPGLGDITAAVGAAVAAVAYLLLSQSRRQKVLARR